MISIKAYFTALLLLTLPFGIIGGGDAPNLTPEQQTAINIWAAIKANNAQKVEALLATFNPQQYNYKVLEDMSESCLTDLRLQPLIMHKGLKSVLLSSVSAGLTVAIPTLCEGSMLEYATMACTGLFAIKHATQAIPSLWKYACYSKYEQKRKDGIAAQNKIQQLIAEKKNKNK